MPGNRPRSRGAWLLFVPAFLLAVFVAWPLASVLGAARLQDWQWATSPYVVRTLVVCAQQAGASTLLAFALALPIAWLHHARSFPGNRAVLSVHALPFVMPVFVIVFGLQATLGAHAPWNVMGWLGPFGAVVLAHAYYNYGFAAQMLHAALQARPRRLEEAAATLGAGPIARLRRVTLPLLWPPTVAVALLVFLFTFASFGTVLYLGEGRIRTLETVLYESLGAFPEWGHAAVLGILELACNGLLMALFLAARRRARRIPSQQAIPAPAASIPLRLLAYTAPAVLMVPIAAVLVGAFRLDGHWSVAPWQALAEHPSGFDLATATGNSLLYALGGTAIAVAAVACLLYGARTWRPAWRKAAEAAASLPMAASSLLIGAAYVRTFGTHSPLPLVATPAILLAAHVVLVLPFVARALVPAFEARDTRLDDAAATLGAGTASLARRIHVPMLSRVLAAAAALGMAMSLADFGAGTQLATSRTAGLATWIARLDGPYQELLHARATALAALVGLLCAAAFLLVERPRWRVA